MVLQWLVMRVVKLSDDKLSVSGERSFEEIDSRSRRGAHIP
jgi:hypothetical protein